MDAGVEGSRLGISGGGNDEEASDAGAVEGIGAEGIDGEGEVAGGGSGGSGSLSREYFLMWMESAPLLLRPEGGGRLWSA